MSAPRLPSKRPRARAPRRRSARRQALAHYSVLGIVLVALWHLGRLEVRR
jgi:hypothetical protein